MKIILLGAPGSGKGTIAKRISQDYSIPQISTGDLFRAIVKEENEFARKIKEILASGSLVPDEITIKMLKDRIEKEDCKNGYILDGFPRSIPQAEALKKIAQIDIVLLVDLPFDTIIERLSSRRTCPNCSEIYSTAKYAGDTCLKCGHKIIQRDDDKPEAIKHRLDVYEKTTAPLINFYSDRLFKVSNDREIDETYRSVKAFLDKAGEE